MASKVIEAVIVGYQPSWKKWPDTGDSDFNSVLAKRQDAYYTVNGEQITVRLRWYPVHRAYAIAGVPQLPAPHPCINNTMVPPQSVLDVMLADLEAVARDGVSMCYWEHAYQCYPATAQHLKRIFKHSILIHGDDCPGSTEIKTQPIAKYFDSIFHANLIWSLTGETTAALYRRMGVQDAHYLALSMTGGFREGIADWLHGTQTDGAADLAAVRAHLAPPPDSGLDLERRLQQLRERRYTYDMVFVGVSAGPYRQQLNSPQFATLCQGLGLRTKLVGTGMRDGILQPWVPATIGRPVAKLYMESFAVLNSQMVGLAATRMWDAWGSGSLLFQWDPFNEMELLGVEPNVHYAAYDGSLPDLVQRVRHYQAHFDEAEAIIRAGHKRGAEIPQEHNMTRATERVLTANAKKLGLE